MRWFTCPTKTIKEKIIHANQPLLKSGDKVAIVFLSGALNGEQQNARFDQGIACLKSWGLNPVLIPEHRQRLWEGYYAGSPQERATALEGFTHGDYPLVIEARGGAGCFDVLDYIKQWQPIKPVKIMGFSDTTSMHVWVVMQGGQSLHGPVITFLGREPEWSQQRLKNYWFSGVLPSIEGRLHSVGQNTPSVFKAKFLVVNLEVFRLFLGYPKFHEFVSRTPHPYFLVFEDVAEPIYKIRRALTHVASTLKGLSNFPWVGFGFGSFLPPEGADQDGYQSQLLNSISFFGESMNKPVPIIEELPLGHDTSNGNAVMIQGGWVEVAIDPEKKATITPLQLFKETQKRSWLRQLSARFID